MAGVLYDEGLVTVVVPVYNVEKYLDRCVNSIVTQTYSILEIILVDDGSPDNCPKKCDLWAKKDPRIHVVHKKNQGLGMARNTGIENAHGEYICFVDSDDYIEKNTIETAYYEAKYNSAQLIIYGMLKEDNNGNILSIKKPSNKKRVFYDKEVKMKLIPAMLNSDCYAERIESGLSCCELLVSHKAIDDAQWRLVSEREIISEDVYSLLVLYSKIESVAVIPQAFYHYCNNEGSLTKTYRKDRFGKIKDFYKKCLILVKQCGYPDSVNSGISSMCFSFIIGMMKTICNANISMIQKMKEVHMVICDDEMRIILNGLEPNRQNANWRILLLALRHRMTIICYILISLKS